MNIDEHLLTCLSEECSEIIKAVSKSLRFGLDDGAPGSDYSNKGDIGRELDDLLGVVELLQERGIFFSSYRYRINEKKDRVEKMLQYAIEKGTVTVD